ncbi:YhcB family protein [Microbulbifer sp. 2201CG32-9]|uniref:YhcB family protein n=1 Tax=unclassified Microbulbifer TaxID=2619833 RepID=UPI00345BEA5B
MHSTSVLILVGVVGLALGAILAFLANRGRGGTDRTQELELRLSEANSKLEDFQLQVNEHFDQTAQLVHNLTKSYREVHEYLANSAVRLSSQDIGRQMLEAGSGKLSDNDESLRDVVPPRDWAPKEPGAKGTLAEDFGLDKEAMAGLENTDAAETGVSR